MKTKSQLIFLIGLLCMAIGAEAQQILNGVITDKQTGEPLIGAEILIPGTSMGTLTNSIGQFTLETKEAVKILEVHYIGYETLQITDFTQGMHVALEESVNSL
ncbi:MAG: carboxypeptidase-like regulatory domain-containing protein, partial [Reichenbachiella sp.]